MNSALQQIVDLRQALIDEERMYAEATSRLMEARERIQKQLDVAMITAVDWAKLPALGVAQLAGYKSHAAIRDARKRIEKRGIEVR